VDEPSFDDVLHAHPRFQFGLDSHMPVPTS
jgi:hypothetical protein